MRALIFLFFGCCIITVACQKSIVAEDFINGRDTIIIANGNDTGVIGNYDDSSSIRAGDKITYEVITKDTTGWYGIWNDSTGQLTSNGLSEITYGSPNPLPSGWKYSFICPNKPFQALISAASFGWQEKTVINLYKNDRLIKSYSDNLLPAAARLIATAKTDSLTGTSAHPLLTYEVFVSDTDTSVFQYNAWFGQWTITADDKPDDYYNPLLTGLAIPSGWRYSFYPDALPFTMRLSAWRQLIDIAGKITINFFVNGQLVKTTYIVNGIIEGDNSYIVK